MGGAADFRITKPPSARSATSRARFQTAGMGGVAKEPVAAEGELSHPVERLAPSRRLSAADAFRIGGVAHAVQHHLGHGLHVLPAGS